MTTTLTIILNAALVVGAIGLLAFVMLRARKLAPVENAMRAAPPVRAAHEVLHTWRADPGARRAHGAPIRATSQLR